MLFSCLFDADFLDTEQYMDSGKQNGRGGHASIDELLKRLDKCMEELTGKAPDTEVNRVRQWVMADRRKAAEQKPGFFSLTVPTGDGKTLSSMAFALKHAVIHKKKRVIYVIPSNVQESLKRAKSFYINGKCVEFSA
jgi:CRISPR-associated endonuclease/helicase Cas3